MKKREDLRKKYLGVKLKKKYSVSDNQDFEGVNVDKINEKIIEIRKKCNIEST